MKRWEDYQKKLVPQDEPKNATPSQGSLSRELKLLMTSGWMLAEIVLSVANKKLAMRIPETIKTQVKP